MMSLMCITVLILALGAGLTAAETPPAGRDPFAKAQIDSVLVSVNGEPVTLLDVVLETAGAERELAGFYTGERLLTETQKVRRSAVENIILRKLVYAQYKEKPFPVPPQEIENLMNGIARDLGDSTRATLEKKIREYGSSMEELRARVLEKIVTDAILAQLCDRAVFITPKDVYDEYCRTPGEWTTPERIELQLLQLEREGGRAGSGVQNTVERLAPLMKKADDAAFRKLVAEYSNAPTASAGGGTGFIDRAKLRPEFTEILKNRKVGDIVGPVETPEAVYFIRVSAIEPEAKIAYSRIRPVIQTRLQEQALRAHRAEYAKKLRSKAVIRYYF